MAGLTQRSTAASRSAAAAAGRKDVVVLTDVTSSSRSVTPPVSNISSSADLKGMNDAPTAANSKGKSLAERSMIPYSFYVTFGTVLGIEYFSGMWGMETVYSWYSSLKGSMITSRDMLGYTRYLAVTAANGGENAATIERAEYVKTGLIFLVCVSLFYVFFVAPFAAGLWTGRKARRHKFHRYMGLSYLIHYVFAWVELFTDYGAAKNSYLCHIVAVNGILQGTSAYFSFKVLPELNDPGYYSDKAVLSRSFVHENIYFTVMAVFGSIYYNENARVVLRSNLGGRIIEYIYVFWPFIVIRPWYPITQFSNAGQTYKGRTVKNQRFYEVATLMVKFFYLWAKYFLGFFMNFMIFLDLVKEEHWQFMHGMLLLNTGTVSLAIFLHTLRFKKVLPAKFTMSLYLAQIYLTFLAVPIIIQMFVSHPKLCAVCFAGLLGNATRNRKIHAVWCGIAMFLLTQTEIEW